MENFTNLLRWYRGAIRTNTPYVIRDFIVRFRVRFPSTYIGMLPWCEGGDHGTISKCEHCLSCSACCECVYCRASGHYVSSEDIAGCCDNCRDCCVCSDDSKFFRSKLTFFPSKKYENKINKSTRFVAAEIEISSCPDDNLTKLIHTVKQWNGSIVEDGSLPSDGFEINTSPASGDQYVKQINEICKWLGYSEANNSCGLHIHVDGRDYTHYELEKLIKLYAKIEPDLFLMVPKRRRGHYSMPCGNTYLNRINNVIFSRFPRDKRVTIVESVYGIADSSLKRKKKDKYGDYRYNAMNLHSWFHRGTVEFRFPNGTVHRENIINWGILFASLLDTAKEKTTTEVDALCDPYFKGKDTLKIVAPRSIHNWIDKRVDMFKHEHAPTT